MINKKRSSIRDVLNYVLSTLHLRSEKKGVITEIITPPLLSEYYRASTTVYTDSELMDIGWHDAQWHSKPNSRFKDNVYYLAGWDEAKRK